MSKKNYMLKREEKTYNVETTKEVCNRFTYEIKNLSCANCAMKIEKQIKKLGEVSNINIDFVNKKVNVTTTLSQSEILKTMNKIADRIEPGTKILNITSEDHKEHFLPKIILLSVGTILFILAYLNILEDKVSIILFLISYAMIGYEVIKKAFLNIIRGKFFDENFLMVIATFAAVYVRSYEEAVAVMLFYEVGELFQDMAVERSRKSITKLVDLQPKYANLLINQELKKVSPESIKVNDVIVVKPGEKIPLDGVVIEGFSTVDTSQLTGESLPRTIEKDSEVLAGFINFSGSLTVLVTKEYNDTAVSKILQLVQDAQSKKAKVEKFITKFARVYTPIVILLSVLIVTLPYFFIANYDFDKFLYRGAIFLVVSCPCALVISVPLSIFAGIGASSRQGILVKGGNYLELLNKANIVVFDKTGTLTKGNFVVVKAEALVGDFNKMLELSQYAESGSNHVIGKAIMKYQDILIDQKRIISHEEIFGQGVIATIDDNEVLVGNDKLMNTYKIDFIPVHEVGTIVYVAINKTYIGYYVISDEIKEDAKDVIANLKAHGVKKTIMLTGDHKTVGEMVGATLNIDEVYAELLPEDKLTILEKVKEQNKEDYVMFVGDGVNDTPVMMASHISFAMGALGSDAAIETSDVVIMNDELHKLIEAKEIAALTTRKLYQNIIFALSVKFAVLILSAFGHVDMWVAVFADVGVSLIAILNAVSILRYRKKYK